jgi:hypothetical protein
MRGKRRISEQNWEFDGSSITAHILMTFKRRGGRKMTIASDGSDAWAPAKPRPDETLIRALVRAHRWKRLLEEWGADQLGNWPKQRVSPAASSTACSA